MKVESKRLLNGWKEYSLYNNNGMSVTVLNYGGVITRIMVPDKHGKIENVVLGYEDFRDYENDSNFFGAIIGRVAGRVKGASFELEGKKYYLETNEGKHHLHGGTKGFHNKLWETKSFQTETEVGLTLSCMSPHDEAGYPGNIKVSVTYTLKADNDFLIEYEAYSDQTTVLTLTNHTYFNLSGNLKQSTHQHEVTMDSKHFAELDNELIPTGNKLDVAGTPFDFRKGCKLAMGIEQGNWQNTIVGHGYDHYFIFNPKKEKKVSVVEKSSGRLLKIETDQPGMVMYTSNNLPEGLKLLEGESKKYLGVCFETQASPASLHHEGFPSVLLEADKKYSKKTLFHFETVS